MPQLNRLRRHRPPCGNLPQMRRAKRGYHCQMKGRRKLIFIAVTILAVGLGWSTFVTTMLDRGTPPPVESLPPGPVPDFKLIESHGQPVARADLHGKIWVADLVFTSCGNTCPILTATMSSLDRALGARDDVRLVSITVTPEYDQPVVLREYAERFHASNKWFFLTGERRRSSTWPIRVSGFQPVLPAPSRTAINLYSWIAPEMCAASSTARNPRAFRNCRRRSKN